MGFKHGHATKKKSPEYDAWQQMKKRCQNKTHLHYKHYGARGITVCDIWARSFEAFLSDVGLRPSKGHSIDRINNDGNYEPGNVRWATRKEQNRNYRRNRMLTYKGETRCMTAWSEVTGINRYTLIARIKRGLSAEEVLTRPVRKQNK